jgi:hypothetical protein
VPAFDTVFDAIANGESVFESLGKFLKQLVTRLVAAAAAAAVLSLIMNSIIPSIGGKSAVSGFKFFDLFKKFTGFQHGGIVTQPTAAIIGEAGPEVVFPIDRLREFLAPNAQQAIVLETKVRGNDIWLSQSRTNQQRNRTY